MGTDRRLCGTLQGEKRRGDDEEEEEEEPRRQNGREEEGSDMSWGTRVPFQTLSHSFSLKRTDVCTHERTRTHTRARPCASGHTKGMKGKGAECGRRWRGGRGGRRGEVERAE